MKLAWNMNSLRKSVLVQVESTAFRCFCTESAAQISCRKSFKDVFWALQASTMTTRLSSPLLFIISQFLFMANIKPALLKWWKCWTKSEMNKKLFLRQREGKRKRGCQKERDVILIYTAYIAEIKLFSPVLPSCHHLHLLLTERRSRCRKVFMGLRFSPLHLTRVHDPSTESTVCVEVNFAWNASENNK